MQMAQLPTPEQAARKILDQFRFGNIRAGEIIMRGALETTAQKEGLRASDVVAGLNYAVNIGWVDVSNPSFVRLTAAGFGEM
jgi:hypothetical protein